MKLNVAFTGHRLNKVGGHEFSIKNMMLKILLALWDLPGAGDLSLNIITGMAVGVDMWAAQCAVHLRDIRGLDATLEAFLPFQAEMQTRKWRKAERDEHGQLLRRAERVFEVSKLDMDASYLRASEAYQERNMAMVDACDFLFAIWDGSLGGTRNCVTYGLETHTPILRWDYSTEELRWYNKDLCEKIHTLKKEA
jgi:uncharacterized phage-like protein YoqJ